MSTHVIEELDTTVAETQALVNSLAPLRAADVPRPLHIAKYIIVERAGREHPVLFPMAIPHNEIYNPRLGRAVAAGFYQIIDHLTTIANGESTTLALGSRPQDADIIRRLLTRPTL